jgi:transglutaminase-like putative cysteine protease
MVRIHARIGLAYQVRPPAADFVFCIQAARTAQQSVPWEELSIQPFVFSQENIDFVTHNRILRLTAPAGPLNVSYRATMDIHHHMQAVDTIDEVPMSALPAHVLPYIYPSRYCQSDALGPTVMALFGSLPRGYRRVQAVLAWVQQTVAFRSNTSHSGTSALDTLRDKAGVCRDFAHLMIALCRALNIPARFTTGFDFGADPMLGPPDFHAYVEVYLGHRWYIFDPSGTAIPMGFVRIGTGRDAADVSFATIFGDIASQPPVIEVHAESAPGSGFDVPVHRDVGISTA